MPKAIRIARSIGFKTELITNGTKRKSEELMSLLDVISIDVDSLVPETNAKLGKSREHVLNAEKLIAQASGLKVRVKVNTVVTKLNVGDIPDLANWVRSKPNVYRLKLFQFLPSYGIAQRNAEFLRITDEEFQDVSQTVRCLMEWWRGQLIVEDNNYMSSAYLSIDQTGSFYVSRNRNGGFVTVTLGPVEVFDLKKLLDDGHISEELFRNRAQLNECAFLKQTQT